MFEFKPLQQEHFEFLFKWLQAPHVQKWWGSEANYIEFESRHRAMISAPLVFPHIVFMNNLAIGYINYWFVEEDLDFKPHFPTNTVGTDQFIGTPELIGKGIGSQFVKEFTNQLLNKNEIGLVITDPDPLNLAAIRCYEKAGFTKSKVMKTTEGLVQLLEKSFITI